jgi:hypothetical protein
MGGTEILQDTPYYLVLFGTYIQWWASLHDVITALQIGRYQFCLKR